MNAAPSNAHVEFNDEWLQATVIGVVPGGTKIQFISDSSTTVIPPREVESRIRYHESAILEEESAAGNGQGGLENVKSSPKAPRTSSSASQHPPKNEVSSSASQRTPKSEEVRHFVHFLLAQLRWQHGLLVADDGSFAEFDAEMSRLDPTLGSSDVVSCSLRHFLIA